MDVSAPRYDDTVSMDHYNTKERIGSLYLSHYQGETTFTRQQDNRG